MKNFLLLFIFICSSNAFAQKTATILVNPEKTYPYDEHSNNKHISWKFNQQPVSYKAGEYVIPLHSNGDLDTLEIISTGEVITYSKGKKSKKTKSTQSFSRKILCKLHDQNQYALSQIFPGNFAVFSLDSFNIEQRIQITITDFPSSDTLFLHINHSNYQITSDTTITYLNENKKMENQLVSTIRVDNRKIDLFEKDVKENEIRSLLDLEYLFLHGESLNIQLNAQKKTSVVSVQ